MMLSMSCSSFKITAETLQPGTSRSLTRQWQSNHGRRWWKKRLYN